MREVKGERKGMEKKKGEEPALPMKNRSRTPGRVGLIFAVASLVNLALTSALIVVCVSTDTVCENAYSVTLTQEDST